MKRTVLIAIALAAGAALSGCGQEENYRNF